MKNLKHHAHKLKNSEVIPELERLGNAPNRHATYLYLLHLQPSHFMHLKHATKDHLGRSHTYFEYPSIILYDSIDFPLLDKLANQNYTHEQLLNDLEDDNVVGGNLWRSIKRVANKASRIYSKINSGVGAVADIASKLPIGPEYQQMAQALKQGTQLHKSIADAVTNATN